MHFETSGGILNKFATCDNTEIIPVEFSISKIIENRIINPPTDNIENVAFLMESFKTSPRLDELINCVEFLFLENALTSILL